MFDRYTWSFSPLVNIKFHSISGLQNLSHQWKNNFVSSTNSQFFSIYEQIILSFQKLSNLLFVEGNNVLWWTKKHSHHWNTKCTSTNYKMHFNELQNALHRWHQNLSHLWTSKLFSIEQQFIFIVELLNLSSTNQKFSWLVNSLTVHPRTPFYFKKLCNFLPLVILNNFSSVISNNSSSTNTI